MLHKITVLEDGHWMDDDPTHRLKRSAGWWEAWFAAHGWRSSRALRVACRLLLGMHGCFLLEYAASCGPGPHVLEYH